MAPKTVKVTVTRFDPDADERPRLQTYEVPYRHDWVVLDALNYIKDELDGSLTYRWSCRMGICGSCGMSVNGVPKLTCAAHLRDYPNGVRIAPLDNFPVVRDLVIDMEDFMSKLSEVKPWVIREKEDALGGGEYQQSQNQVDQYYQFSECINCMLCYSACPVYGMEPDFIGPAALALARRYNLDSRDEGAEQRLAVIGSSAGIWECSFVGECSAVCPKGVDPAKAIQQSKFEITNGWALDMVMPFGKGKK